MMVKNKKNNRQTRIMIKITYLLVVHKERRGFVGGEGFAVVKYLSERDEELVKPKICNHTLILHLHPRKCFVLIVI